MDGPVIGREFPGYLSFGAIPNAFGNPADADRRRRRPGHGQDPVHNDRKTLENPVQLCAGKILTDAKR
jgi:hypothetical protein